MTISDCIARLTRIMKKTGSGAQIKLGSAYNTVNNAYDYFEIHLMSDGNICLVPSDIWDRNSLAKLAEREQQ